MRIVLQYAETKEYLRNGHNTKKLEEARVFAHVQEAVEFVMSQADLPPVRIVMDLSPEMGHERWNTAFDFCPNKAKAKAQSIFRRVVYSEQQTGLPQKQ